VGLVAGGAIDIAKGMLAGLPVEPGMALKTDGGPLPRGQLAEGQNRGGIGLILLTMEAAGPMAGLAALHAPGQLEVGNPRMNRFPKRFTSVVVALDAFPVPHVFRPYYPGNANSLGREGATVNARDCNQCQE